MSEAWQYHSDGTITQPGGMAPSVPQQPPLPSSSGNTTVGSDGGGRIFIDPNQAFQGDQGASELLGQLNRAQWEDWRNRFAPYIEQLAARAQDRAAPGQAARDASQAMGLAFDTNQQAMTQDRQAFGISLTPRQREAQERRNRLQRSGSMVSAGNQARISELDRQQAILAGGMGLSNIPDRVMQQ